MCQQDPHKWSEGIEKFEASAETKKNCPWYIMGKDMEGRHGKWIDTEFELYKAGLYSIHI